MNAYCAAVDWGTTSFRLWLLDATGEILAERRSGEGMLAAGPDGFAAILDAHLSAVGASADLPVIACGNLEDPDRALEILVRGEGDFAAVAKGAIGNPALPNKIADGETPRPFAPEMLMPIATLESTNQWMAVNAAG